MVVHDQHFLALVLQQPVDTNETGGRPAGSCNAVEANLVRGEDSSRCNLRNDESTIACQMTTPSQRHLSKHEQSVTPDMREHCLALTARVNNLAINQRTVVF